MMNFSICWGSFYWLLCNVLELFMRMHISILKILLPCFLFLLLNLNINFFVSIQFAFSNAIKFVILFFIFFYWNISILMRKSLINFQLFQEGEFIIATIKKTLHLIWLWFNVLSHVVFTHCVILLWDSKDLISLCEI